MIYLIHFSQPIGSDRKTAQHYIGYAEGDPAARLALHRAGRGAKITRAAVERGIGLEIVRTWPGDRAVERRLKQRGHAAKLCPVCNPQRWQRNGVLPLATQLELDLFGDEVWPELPEWAKKVCWAEIQAQIGRSGMVDREYPPLSEEEEAALLAVGIIPF
jgi:predicted GIY-YIG superfamily endonuclease